MECVGRILSVRRIFRCLRTRGYSKSKVAFILKKTDEEQHYKCTNFPAVRQIPTFAKVLKSVEGSGNFLSVRGGRCGRRLSALQAFVDGDASAPSKSATIGKMSNRKTENRKQFSEKKVRVKSL